ncbi:MAG TPA: hypothetical protein VMU94_13270 [Streptosporangiaceae bacterium]|nr:hypothetical protein [Streptosporangiaceae bacterium]
MERADRVTTDMVSISQAELAGAILQSRRAERDEFEFRLAGAGGGSGTAAMTTERGLELIDMYLREHEGIQADAVATDSAPADGGLEFRIGPGRVLHLREALKIVLIDGLGLFFAFATTSGFAALFYTWFFLSGADIVRRFMTCFEKIADPQEKQVFEALFALQNRKAAEVAGSDPDADGPPKRTRISVPDQAISEHLGIGEAEVRSILRGMAARDIVTESAGLWSISFW